MYVLSPPHAIRLQVLIALFLAGPVSVSCQPSTLAITSPANGTQVRPGQILSVIVEVHKPYSMVFLLGDVRDGGGWGPDILQQATAPPYRFSVTSPNDGKAHMLDLTATGCLSPGACDDTPDRVSIVVEPAWEPSDNGSDLVRDAPGVTVDARGNPFLHRSAVDYPADARAHGISGTVVVEITPDWEGHVEGVRVVSGPNDLRKHVITTVQAWHLSKRAGRKARQIAIDFDANTSAVKGEALALASYGAPLANYCIWQIVQQGNFVVGAIGIAGISEEGKAQLEKLLPVKVGDSLQGGQITGGLQNVVHNFDDDLSIWALRAGSQISLTILPNGFILETPEQKHQREAFYECNPRPVNQVRSTASSSSAPPASRIVVPAETQAAKLVSRVEPEYPLLAKGNHIQGIVHVHIMIANDGRVFDVQATGQMLLTMAAEAAVRQWVYSPTLVNGQPVEVITDTDLEFFLPN